MLIEAFTHLVAIDIDWFISVLMGNLHFVFVLIAAQIMFFEGKHTLRGFFWIVIILWALADLEPIANLTVFVGGFLTLMYLTKLAVLTISEDSNLFKKYFVPISSIQAYVVLLVYNWFLV